MLALRVFFLLLFSATLAHARPSRMNRPDGDDTTGINDSLFLPRFVVKASLAPLMSLFGSEMNADIGGEFGFKKRFAIDFAGGIVTQSWFSNSNENASGFYGNVTARRYFMNRNGFYLGAGFLFGQKSKSHTVEFASNGGYFKRARATRTYQVIYPCFGWHGSVWSDTRYPIDFTIGPSFETRKFTFTNLGPYEIEQVMEERTKGIEDFPERGSRTGVVIWLKIGFVVMR